MDTEVKFFHGGRNETPDKRPHSLVSQITTSVFSGDLAQSQIAILTTRCKHPKPDALMHARNISPAHWPARFPILDAYNRSSGPLVTYFTDGR